MRLALVVVVVLVGLLVVAVAGLLFGGTLVDVLGTAGYDLAVLAVGGLISIVAARRWLPARSQPLVPALGVQGAHAVWLLNAVLLLRDWGALPHVAALVLPLVSVGVRLDMTSLVVLLAVHGFEALLHFWEWSLAADRSLELPWLVSHLSLRLAGALLTVRALQTIWRRDRRRAHRTGVFALD